VHSKLQKGGSGITVKCVEKRAKCFKLEIPDNSVHTSTYASFPFGEPGLDAQSRRSDKYHSPYYV